MEEALVLKYEPGVVVGLYTPPVRALACYVMADCLRKEESSLQWDTLDAAKPSG